MNAQVEQPHYSAGNTNIVRPCTMFVSSFSSEKLAAARNHRHPSAKNFKNFSQFISKAE